MALRNLFPNPPFKTAIQDSNRQVSIAWLTFFNSLARLGKVLIEDAPLDPPSLVAGATALVTITVRGAAPGDFAAASFDPGAAGVVLHAQVTGDSTVTVVLQNLSAGTINLPAGTLRVRVEQQA